MLLKLNSRDVHSDLLKPEVYLKNTLPVFFGYISASFGISQENRGGGTDPGYIWELPKTAAPTGLASPAAWLQ